jgi:hypothetical protein
MDARWLDRCWPLTKYVQFWDINRCANAYFYIAHEPRSRRYRRVQTRQAQGDKSCSCSRRQQQLSPSRRVGREAYIGSYYRSRRSYHLSLGRVSTTSGSICASRSKCTRRRSYISSCRCRNCTTCWTRSSCWIGGMFMPQCTSSVWLTIFQGPAAGIGGPPPGFPGGFPGAPGFGRGAPPPGFGGFPPGFPAGGPPPPGFNPPRR